MGPYNLPPSAVWFITGCSTGIGYTLCNYLATHTSHRVVATARNLTALDTLPSSPNLLKLALDVTSESSIQSAITSTLKHFDRIDVVVNNAGYGMRQHTELVKEEDARKIMDTNFWGAVRLTQLVLPIMREQSTPRGGLFLQMSSLGGRIGFPGGAFYQASKFALEGFTEGLSKEMAEDWNIHFLLVEPGGVKTNYAATSSSNSSGHDPSSAYSDPNLPTNQLIAYVANPEATKNWAEVERVVQVLYEFVEKGGKMPLRLPLGSDAWGMLSQKVERERRELEDVKEWSGKTSGSEQLNSIGFLTK
jgi:NAD(P)-dependent dehydrogenase (short-subunit alcohol dehydrogenase family)